MLNAPVFDRPPVRLQTPNPSMDPAQLLALVQAEFDPRVRSVRHLSGERDLNFLLTLEGTEQRCVLKVSDAAENPASLALQNATLEHLAQRAPQLPVQRIYRWRQGDHMLALPGEDGVRYARVLAYLPGLPLYEAPPSAAQRQAIGAVLAQLDHALQSLDHPVVTNDALYWDIHRTPELVEWLPSMADAQLRAWGERVFAQYVDEVAPHLDTLPRQFLHNDFNPYNLLLQPTDPTQIAGVLDFGDMVHGPRVFDVAVAASYQAQEHQQPRLACLLEMVQGYQQANPLSHRELALVPLLAAVRCAITLCITERRAQWFPENRRYILRNHGIASAGLRALMEAGLDTVATHLLALHAATPSDAATGDTA